MKPPTLDDVAAVWTAIPPDERAARLALLKEGAKPNADAPIVTRWPAAAKAAGVTVRGLRYAVKAAKIKPVTLPGRSRAIGIRTADLYAMLGVRA